jgi:hypothetical protein
MDLNEIIKLLLSLFIFKYLIIQKKNEYLKNKLINKYYITKKK